MATIEEKITMTICPTLSIDWPGPKSSTCSYPTIEGCKKNMKKPRRVNASMSEHIDQFHHATVPISSGKYKAVRVARLQAITFGIEEWA